MKKKFIFIMLMAMLCALPFIFKAGIKGSAHAINATEVEVVKEEDDEKWTKEDTKEILGYVAVGIGGVSTALAFAIPVYKKIKKAQKDMLEVKLGVAEELKNSKKFKEDANHQEQTYKTQEKELHLATKTINAITGSNK